MSSKPENNFIARVHKRLKNSGVFFQKNSNPYRGGEADVWYSGCEADLWIEYKYLPKLPVRDNSKFVVDLSALQDQWCSRRHREGRNVWVVVGSSKCAFVLTHLAWQKPLTWGEVKNKAISVDTLAADIFKVVGPANWE
jgi:hypothetical protein